ncbi:unnamed protein product (macronuclear) [Paramecium tetraurelia]|uniref:Uncharacterized protein n=1 Tax=Paramecium tetraurelia TaxID=5888 RepID=A0C8L1_PARTE|nr:uncharacterized protein GSPATT00036262001 [Paramecium tetraurelia]CAK67128.1 unnamed protein product [Paramecium tetraurelia]|eukprot:XP_001434525.1 hypothetical protein (macronuclear) [Paramecium tetraurelia strain d4-2]
MSQIVVLCSRHEELPIDLLFKYKQYGLFEEEQKINEKVEVFELTKENGNLLSKILDDIKKPLRRILIISLKGFNY